MSSAERARGLILQHGWNSTAYQIINPGIAHWFASRGDALVGYVRHAGVRVVAGAPVARPERLADVVAEFEGVARDHGDLVCYFGAEERLQQLSALLPHHCTVVLGGQPAWEPANLAGYIHRHASLRAQLHRARNKGIRIACWPSGLVRDNPRLQAVLRGWLGTRGLPALHFLVEPETLSHPEDRMVFVAERGDTVLGFLVASPVPARRGWLIEQVVRAPGAPNGVSESLIEAAASRMVVDGAGYVTLGLAPLSRRAVLPAVPSEWWMEGVFGWVRAHGRRFYDFDGLDAFKAKFQPDHWAPVYAIGNRARFSPRFLYAIASAFTGGAPAWTITKALGRAVGQELRWLAGARRGVSRRWLPAARSAGDPRDGH